MRTQNEQLSTITNKQIPNRTALQFNFHWSLIDKKHPKNFQISYQ